MTVTTAPVPALPIAADLLPAPPAVGAAGKMEETAKQFEAVFLSLLLKEMRESVGPDGLFAGDAGDVQGGLFDLYLGQHLADAGGIGLAATLTRHLSPPTPTHAPGSAPDRR
jgi:peptidoglycan hydrolase FlgJ